MVTCPEGVRLLSEGHQTLCGPYIKSLKSWDAHFIWESVIQVGHDYKSSDDEEEEKLLKSVSAVDTQTFK